MGALRTQGALGRRLHCEAEEAFLCPLCKLALEDSLHLLVSCDVADKVWRESVWAISLHRIPFSFPADLLRVILAADAQLHLEKRYLRHFILNTALVFDSIWFSRNLVVHSRGQVDPKAMVGAIWRRFAEHSCA